MKNTRNPNVEVLRVMAMFMIVLYHSFCHGIYGYKFANLTDWWTMFFSDLTFWHVDAFVAISGWFGIRFSIKKFVSLYGVILFYSVIGCVSWWLLDRSTFGVESVRVTGGWFGGSYLMLMLMAPLLNGAVDRLRGGAGRGMVAYVNGSRD